MSVYGLCLLMVLAPLFGSVLVGLNSRCLRQRTAHGVTILGVASAFLAAIVLAYQVFVNHYTDVSIAYTWLSVAHLQLKIGFLIDPLTVMMALTVTFVSLLVHIYSIGYMHEDPGYARFFSYISLFTFAMLMLVTANNFAQLFFGWEGVGLASYLLIGFWYHKESALAGSLKAFLVNRVGDFGFLLGIAAILAYCQSLDYQDVFAQVRFLGDESISLLPGTHCSLLTCICLLLFVGAMGKSAQIPLHVWLPESMEGPTPISALIHAATMVTAGIFMVARLSPLYQHSQMALTVILTIGATGAVLLGILALVQNDIKRVVAFSTLSQLGVMTAALGAGAYSVALFHLFTHAAFKALLFLGAGSVIVAMHHEQDLMKMGGLARKMPITHACFLIGSLALAGIPPFAGFYSKDLVIEAVQHSHSSMRMYAYVCMLLGAFFTACYSFRAWWLAFWGKPRDQHAYDNAHESPLTITVPLVLLAIPSVLLGAGLVQPLIFSTPGLLADSVVAWPVEALHGSASIAMLLHVLHAPPFWFAVAGIAVCGYLYCRHNQALAVLKQKTAWLQPILRDQYGFDRAYLQFVMGIRCLASWFSNVVDRKMIDGWLVNGSAKLVMSWSCTIRGIQTGVLAHYNFAMMVGLLLLLLSLMWHVHHSWQGFVL